MALPSLKFDPFSLIGGLALIVGFFMGWIQSTEEGAVAIAGYEIGKLAVGGHTYLHALYLVPGIGAALVALSIKKPSLASVIGIISGGLLLLFGVLEVAFFLYEQTFAGLWITVAAAAILLLGGLWSYRRAAPMRAAAKAAKKLEAEKAKGAKRLAKDESATPESATPESATPDSAAAIAEIEDSPDVLTPP